MTTIINHPPFLFLTSKNDILVVLYGQDRRSLIQFGHSLSDFFFLDIPKDCQAAATLPNASISRMNSSPFFVTYS